MSKRQHRIFRTNFRVYDFDIYDEQTANNITAGALIGAVAIATSYKSATV